MSPKLKYFVLTLILLVVGATSFAQEVVTGGSTPPPPPAPGGERIPSLPGLAVPVDENIMLLLVAGLFVGVVYFYKNRTIKA